MEHQTEQITRNLPPYRGVVAVDAEKFSRQDNVFLPDLSATIPNVLQESLERCGLGAAWATRRFPQATGDGYVFGTEPATLPSLVHPFLDKLQEVLEARDGELRALDRQLRLRLRVSINVGPVPDSGDPLRDRISRTTNDTFRLLDATKVKNALAQANSDVTFVVAVLSQQVYEDVVRGGFANLHADRLIPVDAEVSGKEFLQPAWLYVPKPSRGSVTPPGSDGRSVAVPETSSKPDASRDSPSTTIHGNVGQSVSSKEISGGTFSPNFGSDIFRQQPKQDGRS